MLRYNNHPQGRICDRQFSYYTLFYTANVITIYLRSDGTRVRSGVRVTYKLAGKIIIRNFTLLLIHSIYSQITMNVKSQIMVAILAPTHQDLMSVAAEVATITPLLPRHALVSLAVAESKVIMIVSSGGWGTGEPSLQIAQLPPNCPTLLQFDIFIPHIILLKCNMSICMHPPPPLSTSPQIMLLTQVLSFVVQM